MREKTFKKVDLPHSSSKLWRLQNEANRKLKPKAKVEDVETANHEYIDRLSHSHEITLRYARLLEETINSYEKVSSKISQILDSATHNYSNYSKVQELEIIYYKDLSKFKEMEQLESKVLESLSNKFFDKEKELFRFLARIEERFVYYEKSVQSLESQIDSIIIKNKSEKDESEARVQELLATIHNYGEQMEKLKHQTNDNWIHEKKTLQSQLWASYEEKVKNLNEKFVESSMQMEDQINELNREMSNKEKKLVDKYNDNIRQLELQISELKRELVLKDKRLNEGMVQADAHIVDAKREFTVKEKKISERFVEEKLGLESQIVELRKELGKKEDLVEEYLGVIQGLKEEMASVKIKFDGCKDELVRLKGKVVDGKEIQVLKSKLAEVKEELGQTKLKLSDLKEENIEYKTQVKSYKDENEELKEIYEESLKVRELFEKLKDSLHEVFMRYSKSHGEWNQSRWQSEEKTQNFSDVLSEIDFLSYMISKMANDNNWLVDRLAELGQENQKLKENQSPKKLRDDTLNELRATSNAFRGFENARNKLLYQFNESKKDFSLNY